MMIVWRDIGFGITEALARTRYAYSSGTIALRFSLPAFRGRWMLAVEILGRIRLIDGLTLKPIMIG